MNEKSAPTEAVSEPVPSPRPAEEIRADLARAADGSLDAIANWPALSLRLIDDVASLLADRERLSAELADARAEIERLRAELERKGESIENRDDVLRDLRVEVDDLRAQMATSREFARVLAKHQLAEVLPGGVACTCGAELAALNAPLDDGSIHGEGLALAVHQLQQIVGLGADLRKRAVAAERALEAVRAQVAAVEALIPGDGSEFAIFPFQLRAALGVTPGEYLLIPRAALSAASPTTSPEGGYR